MKRKLSPYIIIPASFITLILFGTIFLSLPISHQAGESISFIDALFISTSAVTITGLSPITDLSLILSPFGKIMLGLLIQIGGLSVITISTFIMVILGLQIGMSNRVLLKESLNQKNLSGLVKLVRRIIIITVIIELIGFSVNMFVFAPIYPIDQAIGISLFHSISSFNNAGFDIIGSTSLEAFNGNVLLNLNTTILIMLGGLGFVVINELIQKRSYKKLSIHAKIILKVNLILWIFGTVVFKFSQGALGDYTWLESFFLSVTSRTAGFRTVHVPSMSSLTILITLFLMYVGASPTSTGGGIKTTALYVLYKNVVSFASGKRTVAYNRYISDESKQKVFVLITFSTFLIMLASSLILIFNDLMLKEVIFESISAFSNVGLSLDVTSHLKWPSKIIISSLMFAGRVGPLTILLMFNPHWSHKDTNNVRYIEEKIIVG